MVAFVANTNILELIGLQDALTGDYINNATVTLVDLVDEENVSVAPFSGSPVTMPYVSGTNGNYRGVLDSELPLVGGQCYIAKIAADGGIDRKGFWEFKFKALKRTTR